MKDAICRSADKMFNPNAFIGLSILVFAPHNTEKAEMIVPGTAEGTSKLVTNVCLFVV